MSPILAFRGVAVEYGGKVLGSQDNVKLRFDPSFMTMAANGQL